LKPISGHTIAELIFSLKANLLDWRERWLNIFKFRLNTEYQIVYTNQNSNFYKHLIFKIMKKQILFLAFFVLALMAGTSSAFGQVIPYQTVPSANPACLTPTPFTAGMCTADELHPVQGTTYDYTVAINAGDNVRWFVVNNNDLAPDSLVSALTGILPAANTNIDPANGTGEYILSLGTGTYNGAGAVDNTTIQIAWKYFDGITDQVILVAYVAGADGCTNNIAAYRIIPQPAFTIDIASVLGTGLSPAGPLDTPNEDCVSPIESAFYSGAGTTPSGTLTVDYGENWAFFVVNGANYIDSWMPEFQISYAGGTAPALSAEWAYLGDANDPTAANWNTLTSGATWTSADPVIAGGSAGTPGAVGAGVVPNAVGECIVVRVRLDWGTAIEHDAGIGTLTFAANGIAYDGVGPDFFDDNTNFEDLHYGTCAVDGFTNDEVDYIINPRPQVEMGTPTQETKTGEGIN
jgi:hypothetical protein